MKGLTKFELFIDWLLSLFDRYNCKKGRHKWGYKLSETGMIYVNQLLVPDAAWLCLDCGCRRIHFKQKQNDQKS